MKKFLLLLSMVAVVGCTAANTANEVEAQDPQKARLLKIVEEREQIAEKAKQDKIAAEKAAAERAEEIKAEAAKRAKAIEEAAKAKAEADRIAAEKLAKEKAEAAQKEVKMDISRIDAAMQKLETKVDSYVNSEK